MVVSSPGGLVPKCFRLKQVGRPKRLLCAPDINERYIILHPRLRWVVSHCVGIARFVVARLVSTGRIAHVQLRFMPVVGFIHAQ